MCLKIIKCGGQGFGNTLCKGNCYLTKHLLHYCNNTFSWCLDEFAVRSLASCYIDSQQLIIVVINVLSLRSIASASSSFDNFVYFSNFLMHCCLCIHSWSLIINMIDIEYLRLPLVNRLSQHVVIGSGSKRRQGQHLIVDSRTGLTSMSIP